LIFFKQENKLIKRIKRKREFKRRNRIREKIFREFTEKKQDKRENI